MSACRFAKFADNKLGAISMAILFCKDTIFFVLLQKQLIIKHETP